MNSNNELINFIKNRANKYLDNIQRDEKILGPFARGMKRGKLAGILDVGKPGLQEIRPEGDKEISPVHLITRDDFPIEDDPVSLPERLVCQRFVTYMAV